MHKKSQRNHQINSTSMLLDNRNKRERERKRVVVAHDNIAKG